MRIHLGGTGLVVHRSHRRRVVERIAQPHLSLDLAREQGDELVPNGLVDQDPLSRGTALSRAEERAHAGGFRRRREVRVLKNHKRPIAPHLQQLRLAGGLPRDDQPGLRRTGERNRVGPRVRRQLVAHLWPRAKHKVEDARRQVGLRYALGEQAGAHRRRGRGGPHDGVAAGQRGREHLRRHGVGPVPRRDEAEHAERAAQQKHASSWGGALRDRALQALAVLGRHAEELDELAHLHLGLGLQRLPLVEREDARQLVAAALHHVGHAMEESPALEAGPRPPRGERRVRGGDCKARVRAVALRDRAERLPGGRAYGLDGGAAGRVAPLAVDEHPRRHGAEWGTASDADWKRCDSSTPVLCRWTNQ